MQGILLVVVSCFLAYLVHRFLIGFWGVLRFIQHHPGYRLLFHPFGLISNVFPRARGVTLGSQYVFSDKHEVFQRAGWDVTAMVSMLPTPEVMFNLADAETIKEVTSSRSRFPKPAHLYNGVLFFGPNIIASEHDEWKKYRKICAPAFSDRNNRLVWDETLNIMKGLFEDVWGDKDVITVDHCLDITLPIALFVIGVAAFGRDVSWKEDTSMPPGHEMSYKDALHTATTNSLLKIIVPDWAMGLTKTLRDTKQAYDEIYLYMKEMVRERQNSQKVERHDLFTTLLDANTNEAGSETLTENELISNIFIFLLAGHETTAHTLCFVFALLALYPGEQEKLYQHIKSIIPDGRTPTYEEMPLFVYSMAVFNETLRLFPPVVGIPKIAAEDTSILVGNINGEKTAVPIPKGSLIQIDTAGLHYNPRYWEDPHAFKPERFLKDWPRDAFLPFSAGARACIGRKFFETEGIAVLTMLVSQYQITVKEEPQFAAETFEQRKARLLDCTTVITLTPTRVPLVFTRRT